MRCFAVLTVVAVVSGSSAETAPESVQQLRPAHDRPFFMPRAQRERIKRLIQTQPWAKTEHERLREVAAGGDGFAAALLYALDGDGAHLKIARDYLLKHLGPQAWGVRTYTERLADPDFFKAGTPHLADVYYHIDYKPFVAYDWVYRGLSDEDRKVCREGIEALARYRMRCMDRWLQTPNLVFKPTFMVALAGLTLQDEEMLQWGFFRTEPHGARLGGYFRVLDYMLRDAGPWHEACIYPIAHEDLWCMSIVSRYGSLYDGRDWFAMTLPGGGSPRGLMDYYIQTAYPIERTGHGEGQIRVATYGDGATSGGGDLFLVNPAGRGLNIEKALLAAYHASGDPRYAPFVRMTDDYRPDLWQRRPLPAKTELPPAPSKIWPTYGLAMLRSDESPEYWTGGRAIAVFQLMSQGYGHDHRDKFAITMHGAGRLLYPDYNAIQYESSAIGWTRHSCSHNTLIVDEQDTANAQPTGIRHEFSPEVKYLATSAAGVFEGVEQTRVLMLSPEYLLDVFHAASDLPHTYDYMLHGLGEARPLGGNYRPAANLMPRYWVMENKRVLETDNGWSFEFTHQDEPDSLGGKYGPTWYEHVARVRVSMAAEPGTQVVHGNWGEKYEKLVAERYKGKGKLDRLAALVVRRTDRPATVFVATHEPYANQQRPQVRGVATLARRDAAVLVRVDAEQFTDYAAVSFGPQVDRPLHVLSDGRVTVQFRDYAYVRVFGDGRTIVRGGLTGLRLPGVNGPLTLNGRRVSAARGDDALVYLSTEATPAPAVAPRCPLDVNVSPKQLRVWVRDRKSLDFSIRNPLRVPVSGHIEFQLPHGITVQPARPSFDLLRTGQTARLPVQFHISDPLPGKLTIPYRIVYGEGGAPQPIHTRSQPLVAYIGPTIEPQFQFPKPPVHRAVTSRYTAALRAGDGAVVYLADDTDRVRLDGEPMFLLSEGEGDERVEMLGKEAKTLGVWPGHQPANVVAEAYGRTEQRTQRCRWQAIFNVGSIMFRMDPDWSRFERARVTVPGNWISSGGKPRWRRVVTVDGGGKERDGRPGANELVAAALLDFPDGEYDLGFQFQPPQRVTFGDTGLEFTVAVVPRDKWFVGFCKPEEFDAWRGK
jgi:hypothetical protein